MIVGNLIPAYVTVPLRGKSSFLFTFQDSAGALLDLTDLSFTFQVFKNPDDPLASAIISVDDTVITPLNNLANGVIQIDLSALDAAKLSAQRLYAFLAIAKDAADEIVQALPGFLIATNNCFSVVTLNQDPNAITDETGKAVTDEAGAAITTP